MKRDSGRKNIQEDIKRLAIIQEKLLLARKGDIIEWDNLYFLVQEWRTELTRYYANKYHKYPEITNNQLINEENKSIVNSYTILDINPIMYEK
uniref:hypothetical protein n=1 Tax=Bacteroides cellulosilyticus TaxID=246787 RepID=UPI003FEF8F48